jgi:hypothetical protein
MKKDILKVELSKEQKKHYKSIKWLLTGVPWRAGRSYLMAVIFIEMAFHSPNEWICIYDHNPHRQSIYFLVHQIEAILDRNRNIGYELTTGSDFKLKIIGYKKSKLK